MPSGFVTEKEFVFVVCNSEVDILVHLEAFERYYNAKHNFILFGIPPFSSSQLFGWLQKKSRTVNSETLANQYLPLT